MKSPVFEEFDPGGDCDCPGCVHWRRVLPRSPAGRTTTHPAAHRALAVAAVAAATLGAGHAVPAAAAPHAPHRSGVFADDDPETPQGDTAPLHGADGREGKPSDALEPAAITRTEIMDRAKTWVAAKVPYNMNAYWSDGYRQDCSGYVSMAWQLPGNEWTGSLDRFGERISKEELQPGDILLFHNPANPESGSHVVIFGGWTNIKHTSYMAYEQARPHTRRQSTPYAYSSDSDRYVPYRYKGVAAQEEPVPGKGRGMPGAPAATPYPGATYFGPGANNKYVTQLGRMLVARGAGASYPSEPGPRWTDAHRRATRAFQRAQGWKGPDADGLPGPRTWELLVTGKGKDVTAEAAGPQPSSHGVPGYPGRAMFRPGASNPYVTRLGRQLVRKGFGRFYPDRPGPRWGESDRRAVEAFQRSQGWRGGAADGLPGPETWRRLFS
ncbi:peptidoglycan-binding protein [Streptomyces violaceus]|uniref:Peptidoglycan-binding protein n=1 Tax=Streptomyces violaceus TaxID=1936 RepID=A0ABY9UCT9_STRVL|nr:peptidoglycan-binding protein [Streptomyces janthinus]WND20694.1 peptidoglycan-binding protein [Streptomyces janthinus]GGS51284.1 membrane protein [Streptomyces janthinus]